MSYSFSVKSATKEGAKAEVAKYFNEQVCAHQPVHFRDRDAALANANAVIDLLADDDTKDIHVSCNGYASWSSNANADEAPLSGMSIASNAALVNRE